MLDLSRVTYKTILLTETGKQLDLSSIHTALSWEENNRELATRINCSLYNTKFEGQNISDLAKPGCMIYVIAECGNVKEEVARGTIVEWAAARSNADNTLTLTCFNELYNLQKSQDSLFYSAGISTQSAIMDVLGKWGVAVAEYKGPNVTHGKLIYNSQYLSDIIIKILDDAVKLGGEKCILRSVSGKLSILPLGNNSQIYHFGEENTISTSVRYSTANMVTRVKVLTKEDKEGQPKVEAVLDGKTEFGIRQRIYVRPQDDSLETAKSAAQKILDEQGDIEKTFSFDTADVPFIRKGDAVHMDVGALNGFYIVKGIRHDASSGRMSMDLEMKK